MNEKRKIQAAIRILGEERLGELLSRNGYFGEPTEALVQKAINQKGEAFVRLLNSEAEKCASRFGGRVVKISRLDGDATTVPATTTAPTTTAASDSSGVKGWIDSAFGWAKTSSDIGLDWAKLYKDNPGAKVDAYGNLVDANGTLLAMAGTNTPTASNNTLLYIAAGVVALVVVGAVFLRK